MTKQEQIEEMAVIGCVRNPQAHTAEECAKCDFKQGQCNAYRHAEALYNAGYGDISEYKAEREMLGSQIKVLKQRLNDKYIEIDNLNRDYSNAFERLKSQQQEIERLKAENVRLTTKLGQVLLSIDTVKEMNTMCSIDEQRKQAKIDVLNELKKKIHDTRLNDDTAEIIIEMIEELQNAEDKS